MDGENSCMFSVDLFGALNRVQGNERMEDALLGAGDINFCGRAISLRIAEGVVCPHGAVRGEGPRKSCELSGMSETDFQARMAVAAMMPFRSII